MYYSEECMYGTAQVGYETVYAPRWPTVEQLVYAAAQRSTGSVHHLTPEGVALCLFCSRLPQASEVFPTSVGAPLASPGYVVHTSFCRSAQDPLATAASFVTSWGVFTVELYSAVRMAVPGALIARLGLQALEPQEVDETYGRADARNLRALHPPDTADGRGGFPQARLLWSFPLDQATASVAMQYHFFQWSKEVGRALGPPPDRPLACAGCRDFYREPRRRCLWPGGADLLGRLCQAACRPGAVRVGPLSVIRATDLLLAAMQEDESGWPALRELPSLCVENAVMLQDRFLCQQLAVDAGVWIFYFLTDRGGCTVTVGRRTCQRMAQAAETRGGSPGGPERPRPLRQVWLPGDEPGPASDEADLDRRPYVVHWMPKQRDRTVVCRALAARQIGLLGRAASLSRHVAPLSAEPPPPHPGWCVWSGCPGTSYVSPRWSHWEWVDCQPRPEDAAVYRQMSRLLETAERSVPHLACLACTWNRGSDHFCQGPFDDEATLTELRRILVRWGDDVAGGWHTLCQEAVLAAGLSLDEPRHVVSARAFMHEVLPDLFRPPASFGRRLLSLFSAEQGRRECVHFGRRSQTLPRNWGRSQELAWMCGDTRYICWTADSY